MKKICSWVIILTLVALPVLTYAQRSRSGTPQSEETEGSIVEQATRDAEYYARLDANGCLWFGLGFLFTAITVAVAFLVSPGPDELVLLGKSPEYVYTYTRVYRQKRHALQVRYAILGCSTGALLNFLVWTLVASQEDWPSCLSDDCSWNCGYSGCTADQRAPTE